MPRHGLRTHDATASAPPVPAGTDGALELGAQGIAAQPACQVVAHVDDGLRSRLHAEHRVERGHAVRLGRRDGQALADVVQAALADPSGAGLQRVQGGEQQVALVASRAPAAREPGLDATVADTTDPARLGRTEERIDGGPLLLGGSGGRQVEIHDAPVTRRRASRRSRRPATASRSGSRWP